MDDSIGRLGQLADAARQHAREVHGIELSPEHGSEVGWAAIERVLRKEQRDAEGERLETLAACYGAWLGFWAVTALDGVWTGLHEPVAPRVRVAGKCFSPIDAVRRVLLGEPDAVGVREVVQRVQAWRDRAIAERQDYLRQNKAAWDGREHDLRFAGPAALPTDRAAALRAIDPWLHGEPMQGQRLLCLAAGGGLHGPLHALAGADVTVVDLSDRQLEHDRRIASELGLDLRTVCRSIDRLAPLSDSSFDIVVQPVSSCYLPHLEAMYAEVARVLRPGGVYISQHKQPGSLQAELLPRRVDGEAGYWIRTPLVEGCRLDDLPGDAVDWTREPGTAEFLHSLGSILGGLCASGFLIEAVDEPPRGDGLMPAGTPEHRACYLRPYIKIKARRTT